MRQNFLGESKVKKKSVPIDVQRAFNCHSDTVVLAELIEPSDLVDAKRSKAGRKKWRRWLKFGRSHKNSKFKLLGVNFKKDNLFFFLKLILLSMLVLFLIGISAFIILAFLQHSTAVINNSNADQQLNVLEKFNASDYPSQSVNISGHHNLEFKSQNSIAHLFGVHTSSNSSYHRPTKLSRKNRAPPTQLVFPPSLFHKYVVLANYVLQSGLFEKSGSKQAIRGELVSFASNPGMRSSVTLSFDRAINIFTDPNFTNIASIQLAFNLFVREFSKNPISLRSITTSFKNEFEDVEELLTDFNWALERAGINRHTFILEDRRVELPVCLAISNDSPDGINDALSAVNGVSIVWQRFIKTNAILGDERNYEIKRCTQKEKLVLALHFAASAKLSAGRFLKNNQNGLNNPPTITKERKLDPDDLVQLSLEIESKEKIIISLSSNLWAPIQSELISFSTFHQMAIKVSKNGVLSTVEFAKFVKESSIQIGIWNNGQVISPDSLFDKLKSILSGDVLDPQPEQYRVNMDLDDDENKKLAEDEVEESDEPELFFSSIDSYDFDAIASISSIPTNLITQEDISENVNVTVEDVYQMCREKLAEKIGASGGYNYSKMLQEGIGDGHAGKTDFIVSNYFNPKTADGSIILEDPDNRVNFHTCTIAASIPRTGAGRYNYRNMWKHLRTTVRLLLRYEMTHKTLIDDPFTEEEDMIELEDNTVLTSSILHKCEKRMEEFNSENIDWKLLRERLELSLPPSKRKLLQKPDEEDEENKEDDKDSEEDGDNDEEDEPEEDASDNGLKRLTPSEMWKFYLWRQFGKKSCIIVLGCAPVKCKRWKSNEYQFSGSAPVTLLLSAVKQKMRIDEKKGKELLNSNSVDVSIKDYFILDQHSKEKCDRRLKEIYDGSDNSPLKMEFPDKMDFPRLLADIDNWSEDLVSRHFIDHRKFRVKKTGAVLIFSCILRSYVVGGDGKKTIKSELGKIVRGSRAHRSFNGPKCKEWIVSNEIKSKCDQQLQKLLPNGDIKSLTPRTMEPGDVKKYFLMDIKWPENLRCRISIIDRRACTVLKFDHESNPSNFDRNSAEKCIISAIRRRDNELLWEHTNSMLRQNNIYDFFGASKFLMEKLGVYDDFENSRFDKIIKKVKKLSPSEVSYCFIRPHFSPGMIVDIFCKAPHWKAEKNELLPCLHRLKVEIPLKPYKDLEAEYWETLDVDYIIKKHRDMLLKTIPGSTTADGKINYNAILNYYNDNRDDTIFVRSLLTQFPTNNIDIRKRYCVLSLTPIALIKPNGVAYINTLRVHVQLFLGRMIAQLNDLDVFGGKIGLRSLQPFLFDYYNNENTGLYLAEPSSLYLKAVEENNLNIGSVEYKIWNDLCSPLSIESPSLKDLYVYTLVKKDCWDPTSSPTILSSDECVIYIGKGPVERSLVHVKETVDLPAHDRLPKHRAIWASINKSKGLYIVFLTKYKTDACSFGAEASAIRSYGLLRLENIIQGTFVPLVTKFNTLDDVDKLGAYYLLNPIEYLEIDYSSATNELRIGEIKKIKKIHNV